MWCIVLSDLLSVKTLNPTLNLSKQTCTHICFPSPKRAAHHDHVWQAVYYGTWQHCLILRQPANFMDCCYLLSTEALLILRPLHTRDIFCVINSHICMLYCCICIFSEQDWVFVNFCIMNNGITQLSCAERMSKLLMTMIDLFIVCFSSRCDKGQKIYRKWDKWDFAWPQFLLAQTAV